MKGCNKKLIVFLVVASLFFVFACDKQPESTVPEEQAPVSEEETKDFAEENENLIEEYGETMITAYTKGKQAGKTGIPWSPHQRFWSRCRREIDSDLPATRPSAALPIVAGIST